MLVYGALLHDNPQDEKKMVQGLNSISALEKHIFRGIGTDCLGLICNDGLVLAAMAGAEKDDIFTSYGNLEIVAVRTPPAYIQPQENTSILYTPVKKENGYVLEPRTSRGLNKPQWYMHAPGNKIELPEVRGNLAAILGAVPDGKAGLHPADVHAMFKQFYNTLK